MKSHFNPTLILCLLIPLSLPAVLYAQLSTGGLPCSFSQAISPDNLNYVTVSPPSDDNLLREYQQPDVPYHFALNLPVDLGIGSSGSWKKAVDGTKVWRLNLKSPGALALTLYFDRFNIPGTGKLYVYNPQRTQLLGAFSSLNNNDFSTFATALIYGDQLTLEYNAPDSLPLPELHISEVAYAYRGISDYTDQSLGFGGSGKCEVNVNCSEGSNWQNEKRGVTRINVKRGSSSLWCTGSLINNVRNDGKPYVLTADHCGYLSSAIDISQWIFYFNYEGPGCPKPASEPSLKSMTGASLVAHGGNAGSSGSDFFLVLLKSAVPDSYNVYFNGWSRETASPSPSGSTIHHPEGDIKKISTYTSPLQPAHWVGNPYVAHWRVTWSATSSGHGVTEPGSSGSPLFDNQGRLVGTLTGGDSKCDSASWNLPDYYGMFSYHWDQNGTDSISRLKYWLDPDNTNVMTLTGWALSVKEPLHKEVVKIFPNPVTDWLTVQPSAFGRKSLQVTICDIWGILRFQRDLSTGVNQELQIDMSGFAPGIYLLGLTDGDQRVVKKIIKQ